MAVLNTQKINEKLKAEKRSRAWLADEMGIDRATLHYALKNQILKDYPEKIAPHIKVKPADLILIVK